MNDQVCSNNNKMSAEIAGESRYKLPLLDHFRLRHAPFLDVILSKEYLMTIVINK